MNQKNKAIEFLNQKKIFAMVGITDALEAINIASEPGWISVDERLPTDSKEVLVIQNDSNMEVMYYEDSDWWCNGEIYYNITCWQPLPSLPETKKA